MIRMCGAGKGLVSLVMWSGHVLSDTGSPSRRHLWDGASWGFSWFQSSFWSLPSGKHTKNYGKSPCLMGKFHYKWPFFNSYFDITRGYFVEVNWSQLKSLDHPGAPWRCGICMVRCTPVASRAAEGRMGFVLWAPTRQRKQFVGATCFTDGLIVYIYIYHLYILCIIIYYNYVYIYIYIYIYMDIYI